MEGEDTGGIMSSRCREMFCVGGKLLADVSLNDKEGKALGRDFKGVKKNSPSLFISIFFSF